MADNGAGASLTPGSSTTAPAKGDHSSLEGGSSGGGSSHGASSDGWGQSSKSYLALATKITGFMAERALEKHSALWAKPEGGSTGEGTSSKEGCIQFLDVAAGPGGFSKILAAKLKEHGKPYKIYCTDYSEGMVALAQQAMIDNADVTTMQMDGQDISRFEDGSMDGVNCLFGIMFMEQYHKCVSEMRRVLKTGAKATLGTWLKPGFLDMADAFGIFLGAMEPEELSAGQRLMLVGKQPEQLAGYCLAAGFADVEVTNVEYRLVVQDVAPLYDLIVDNLILKQSVITGKENASAPSLDLFREFLDKSALGEPFRLADAGGYAVENVCNMAVVEA